MDSPMPDDPARPLGRDILKLRALFVPEGAADQASTADAWANRSGA
jgi:hypothetical protein